MKLQCSVSQGCADGLLGVCLRGAELGKAQFAGLPHDRTTSESIMLRSRRIGGAGSEAGSTSPSGQVCMMSMMLSSRSPCHPRACMAAQTASAMHMHVQEVQQLSIVRVLLPHRTPLPLNPRHLEASMTHHPMPQACSLSTAMVKCTEASSASPAP